MRSLLLLLALVGCAPKVVEPAAPEPVVVDPLATQPVVAASPSFTPPVPTAGELSNGATVWTIANPALPLVSFEIRVPGGSMLDSVGKEGTAALGARMLTQGAGKLDSTSFAATVERLGIAIESSVTEDDAIIHGSCTKEVLPQALDLVADMVLRPTFAKADFTRERDLAISGIQENLDEPGYVAARTAASLWWGKDHPYGRPSDGTIGGLKKLSTKDLQAWHKAAWGAAGASIVVAGAVTQEEITALLEPRLGAPWKATDRPEARFAPAPAHTDAPIYLVDKPNSAQTGFYLVFPGVREGDALLQPIRAGSIVFGGTFTSRLNGLLREKRGYTYGVRAAPEPLRQGGTLLIRTRIRADVTAPALADILAELDNIRKGITPDELAKAQGAYKQDLVEAMETRDGIASTFAEVAASGRPTDTLGSLLTSMNGITTEAVAPAMANWDRSKSVFVLVGDRAKIEPALKEAGQTRIEIVSPP